MDRNRLVDRSLGRLNRGLLIFRLGLYAAVMVGLVERLGNDAGIAIPVVAAVALLPAFPSLPRKIEIGIATTLVLEFVLTIAVGAFLALQFLPLFSVVVARLAANLDNGIIQQTPSESTRGVSVRRLSFRSLSGM